MAWFKNYKFVIKDPSGKKLHEDTVYFVLTTKELLESAVKPKAEELGLAEGEWSWDYREVKR